MSILGLINILASTFCVALRLFKLPEHKILRICSIVATFSTGESKLCFKYGIQESRTSANAEFWEDKITSYQLGKKYNKQNNAHGRDQQNKSNGLTRIINSQIGQIGFIPFQGLKQDYMLCKWIDDSLEWNFSSPISKYVTILW